MRLWITGTIYGNHQHVDSPLPKRSRKIVVLNKLLQVRSNRELVGYDQKKAMLIVVVKM